MAFQLLEEICKEGSLIIQIILFFLTLRAVMAAVVGLPARFLEASLVTWHAYFGEDVMVLSCNKVHIKSKFITIVPS